MIRTLLKELKQYKKYAILTPIATAMEVVLEILIPYITAMLIDKGVNAGDMSNVLRYGGIMLGLAFLSLFSGAGAGHLAAVASTGFAANLREAMYVKIQDYSFTNIDRFSTAGLVTRMTTDVTNVQNAFQMTLRIAVRAPLMLIFSVIMCFTINIKISFIFLGVLVFLGSILAAIMFRAMPVFKVMFERYDDLNASIQENVSGIRVVKSFVREDYENDKFLNAASKIYELSIKAEKHLILNNPVMMFSIYACIIAISWFGAHFIVSGTMTTGNLTSLFSYVMSMLGSLMMLSMIFVMMSMSLASANRIGEVLNEEIDMKEPDDPVYEVKDGSIEFHDVNFAYKQEGTGKDNLNHIYLDIKPGQTIGIIGGTGCGKSTLVSLISRLYDVKSGYVKVGGVDVRDYDIKTLRDAVSVVLQKNVLFSGTILDNLRWGNEDATEEECRQACILACADEFIQQMPDKYDTWIEQGGNNVSGGQKQRICIARALLKKPKVLILDDSTSAVDTATDAKIRKAMKEVIPGTTKIIISQRISSIEDSDMIIVMEDGHVDEFNTPEAMREHNKIYNEIYEAQKNQGGDFDKLEN